MVELDEAIEDPPKLGRNLPEASFGGSCSSDKFRPREESRLSMGRRAPPMASRAPATPSAFRAGAVEGSTESSSRADAVVGSTEYVHSSRHAPDAAFAEPARRLYTSASNSQSASESESASASAPELPPQNAGGRPAGGGLERRGEACRSCPRHHLAATQRCKHRTTPRASDVARANLRGLNGMA